MKVKDLKELLKDIPDDYNLCISAAEFVTTEENENFELIFDTPISGIAVNDSDKELRFAFVEKKYKDGFHLARFGKPIKRLKEEVVVKEGE